MTHISVLHCVSLILNQSFSSRFSNKFLCHFIQSESITKNIVNTLIITAIVILYLITFKLLFKIHRLAIYQYITQNYFTSLLIEYFEEYRTLLYTIIFEGSTLKYNTVKLVHKVATTNIIVLLVHVVATRPGTLCKLAKQSHCS